METVNISGYQVETDGGIVKGECKGAGGTVGKAKKNGKTYFFKEFKKPTFPDSSSKLSAAALAKKKGEADQFRKKREKVNNTLKKIVKKGSNVIVPLDWGVYNNHWFEFTEFVDDVVSDASYHDVIQKLSEEDKLKVFKNALLAIQTIHSMGIVHGDLKLTNIMLSLNNATGNYYESKIIDFDGAFFENDMPLEGMTGTPDYYSPELGLYSVEEDESTRKEKFKDITVKSDIFTMGLVFHEYLTGEKPSYSCLPECFKKAGASSKKIYPWVFLVNTSDDEKYQFEISKDIKNEVYIALISDMLNRNYQDRPTASELILRLQTRKLPIETETWPDDNIEFRKNEISKKYIGLKRSYTKEGKECYEVIAKDGKRYRKNANDLLSEGLATKKYAVDDWCKPRKSDNIAWDTDKLSSSNFISTEDAGEGFYYLKNKNDSKKIKYPLQTLIAVGLAIRLKDKLFEEDHAKYKLNPTMPGNMKFITAIILNGKKRYKCLIDGYARYLPSDQCEIYGIFLKK